MNPSGHDCTEDETEYLRSSLNNAIALMESIHEADVMFPTCRELGPRDIEDFFAMRAAVFDG